MSEEIEINEEIKNKTYHKFVETEAIAKVKSNRRNREVEIVLSETHLSWNFIGTDWRVPKSKRFKTFTLDSINLDFRKGSKGFLGSTSSELLIIRSRREQWSIMFDQGQNDEFEQFTELFDITKGKNAKTTIDANEIFRKSIVIEITATHTPYGTTVHAFGIFHTVRTSIIYA